MSDIIIERVTPLGNPKYYSQVLKLRNQFELMSIPLGSDFFEEYLSRELNHVTFAAIIKPIGNNNEVLEDMDKVVGCVMLAPLDGDDKTLRVRQQAVSSDFQRQGVGAKLLTKAAEYAKEQGKVRLYLHGRREVLDFHLKCGYRKLNEKEFIEFGVIHVALEKMLK